MAKSTETPMMKQYYATQAQYPDALLLYRMGDFYETFGQDAIITAKVLGITLTKRSSGNPGSAELAGFPHHAIETYLPKLVRAGYRVAICEQLEDPKKAKGIVKRGVIELVTPGVSYSENTRDIKNNHFLASVYFNKADIGLSLLDLGTGEFLTTEGSQGSIDKLLNSFQPKEIIYPRGKENLFIEYFGSKYYIYPIEEWFFELHSSKERLIKHFETNSLKGFGIEKLNSGICASGGILSYLELTKHDMKAHITSISLIDESRNMLLDRFTMRNLEILHPSYEGGSSLSDILDTCITPMGSRNLRRILCMPLKDINEINKRLDLVECFYQNELLRIDIQSELRNIGDLERLVTRIGVGRISPREMNQLKTALKSLPEIKILGKNVNNISLNKLLENIDNCEKLLYKIDKCIEDNAPVQIVKGGVIRSGVNEELDELREISLGGKRKLDEIQQRESEATGIPSLKIGFNNVFGYYIEITKTHKDKAPETWIRKQTLVNGERYITPELKEYEDKILGAQDKILSIETSIFLSLMNEANHYLRQLQKNAKILANIDSYISFADVAIANNYCRPSINDGDTIEIKEGRHPVIERSLPLGEEYISNNIYLDRESQQIIIITGPNMAGKSALLRQTALIAIMAQAGSFVPAQSANIGFLDRIFTRVGASDNISSGESTFMVEMNEAAAILNNITDRSLVLFDELGRGTSTYDGISIAWSIVEYLHEHPKFKAKVLFATHYHELNEMINSFKRIKNYNVSVKEINKKIIFLRKLIEGGSNHSFGIQVGRMAGLPKSVIERADKILKELENNRESKNIPNKEVKHLAETREGMQLSFFQLDDPVLSQIRDEIIGLDINALTPLDALNKLNEIKKILGQN